MSTATTHTHHDFTKWVVQPGTGRFYLVPDAELTHTIRVVASALEDILPMAHILAANALAPTVTQYAIQHDFMWQLTHALIQAFMAHDNWAANETPPLLPNTNAPMAETAADLSDAPSPPHTNDFWA